MARLFSHINLAALKSIDPLDCFADGTDEVLLEGDRAIILNESNQTIFYSLETGVGHIDDGIEEVIPNNNAGNWYWKCRGYTNGTFIGASPGDEFAILDGSRLPPSGFTSADIPYEEYAYDYMDMANGDSSVNDGTYRRKTSGMYGDHFFIMGTTDYVKINMRTDVVEELPFGLTTAFEGISGHSAEATDGSEKYISGLVSTDAVNILRFNMKTEEYDTIEYVFAQDESWATVMPVASLPGYSGVRLGKWHYNWPGDYRYPSVDHCRVNILTGDVEKLADVPNVVKYTWFCPDFDNDCFYMAAMDAGSGYFFYKYDTVGDVWTTLTAHPDIVEMYVSAPTWLDTKTNRVIWYCGITLNVYLYDIALNYWEVVRSVSYTDWYDTYSTSVHYKGLGCIYPYGHEPGNANVYVHTIIKEDNPITITKV